MLFRSLSAVLAGSLCVAILLLNMHWNNQSLLYYLDPSSFFYPVIALCIWGAARPGKPLSPFAGAASLNGAVWIALVTSSILFFGNLDTPMRMGAALAMFFLVPLYSLLIRLLIEPFQHRKLSSQGINSDFQSQQRSQMAGDGILMSTAVSVSLAMLVLISLMPTPQVSKSAAGSGLDAALDALIEPPALQDKENLND